MSSSQSANREFFNEIMNKVELSADLLGDYVDTLSTEEQADFFSFLLKHSLAYSTFLEETAKKERLDRAKQVSSYFKDPEMAGLIYKLTSGDYEATDNVASIGISFAVAIKRDSTEEKGDSSSEEEEEEEESSSEEEEEEEEESSSEEA